MASRALWQLHQTTLPCGELESGACVVAILDEEQDGATNYKAMEGDPALPTSRVVCWVAQITRHGCDTKLCRKSPTTAIPQAEAGPRLPTASAIHTA